MKQPSLPRPGMLKSLRGQLLISHLVVTLVSVALVTAFAGRALARSRIAEAEHSLEDVGFVLSNELEEPMTHFLKGEGGATVIRAVLDKHLSSAYPQLVVISANGQVIMPSSITLVGDDPSSAIEVHEALGGQDTHTIRVDDDGREMIYGAVAIQHEGQVFGVLQLATPMAPVREKIAATLITLSAVTIGVAVLVGGAGWWLAGQLTRPLARLTAAAGRLAEGKLDGPVTTGARAEELIRLESAFNDMAHRLQKLLADQRAFVANASHELRTPLTSLKLRAEALSSGALSDSEIAPRFVAEIESEVDRLTKMVNDLLDLSRIESGIAADQHEPVELAQLAAEARDAFSARADRAGVTINVEVIKAPPAVAANESHLRRLLDNLLDNAVKYTAAGGSVTMRVQAEPRHHAVRLEVRDTGVGIPAEQLPHIFDRFYRGELPHHRTGSVRSREGSGLGLSIVQSIVDAYGGDVRADSTPGAGTTVTIRLPVFSQRN